MTGEHVRVTYKRSLGRTTDMVNIKATQRIRVPIVGKILLLEVDAPLVVQLSTGKVWHTSSDVSHIDQGDRITEVYTENSVYQIRREKESQ